VYTQPHMETIISTYLVEHSFAVMTYWDV